MVQVGDIVEVIQFPGVRWAVVAPHEHGVPPGSRWRLQRPGRIVRRDRWLGRVAGQGDLSVLDRPRFSAGQLVRYLGEQAVVVRDDGDTVRIRYAAPRPTALSRQSGIGTEQRHETDVGRGSLVAHNLEASE